MDYKLNLVVGEPIDFYGICTIYQPTLKDIMKFGIDKYEKLLIPYKITKEIFTINNNISDFDLLRTKIKNRDSEEYIDVLSLFIQSLKFFCKIEEKEISINAYDNSFVFNNDLNKSINRENFEEFCKIILEVNGTEKIKIEKSPMFSSERQKQIWELSQKGRAKSSKKDSINFATIVNIVKFGMDSLISKDIIKNMTIWEINNAYENIMKKERYRENLDICLVAGNENNELDLIHWSIKMKLD